MKARTIIIFLGIGVILCEIIAGLIFWWPKTQAFISMRSQLSSFESQAQQRQEYLDNLKSLKNQIETYKESLQKIDSALPSDPNVSKESGTTLSSLDKGTSVTSNSEKGTAEFAFTMAGSGSYQAIKNLLYNLYQNARIIDVESIKLTASQKPEQKLQPKASPSPNEDEFTFSLSLTTNFMPLSASK